MLLAVIVHPASVQDRDGAEPLLREAVAILEPLQPSVRNVRFDEFLDFSFLDQLEREGFFASLGRR